LRASNAGAEEEKRPKRARIVREFNMGLRSVSVFLANPILVEFDRTGVEFDAAPKLSEN
jgi:hypothetical protein